MRRDAHIDHSILLAIEAKTSISPAPIDIPGVDRQVILNHLASMYDEGLYSGPRPHKSSGTGEIDAALVSDLTPVGRKRLAELNHAAAIKPEVPYEARDVTFLPDSVPSSGLAGGNRALVLLQVDALLLVVRSEIGRLRDRRLNNDPELRDLEEFEEQVDRLRSITVDAAQGHATPENVAKTGRSFGSYLRSWFDKHHEQILTDGFETLNGGFKVAMFLSATAICASLKVEPTLAATVSGVLLGGAPVKDAIKAAAGMLKKFKKPPA